MARLPSSKAQPRELVPVLERLGLQTDPAEGGAPAPVPECDGYRLNSWPTEGLERGSRLARRRQPSMADFGESST